MFQTFWFYHSKLQSTSRDTFDKFSAKSYFWTKTEFVWWVSILSRVSFFQSMLSKTCVTMTPFLMFEGMMDFSLSVHSVHLSCMNTVSVFDKPWPNCLRLFTTICDPVFTNMVIDNSNWLKSDCAPGTNDCIFWAISLIFVALL